MAHCIEAGCVDFNRWLIGDSLRLSSQGEKGGIQLEGFTSFYCPPGMVNDYALLFFQPSEGLPPPFFDLPPPFLDLPPPFFDLPPPLLDLP